MTPWEYKVVPAPARGEKARGVKGAEARFAYALQRLMNEMGAEGWEYQRSETLPSEERSGLTSKVTTWRNVLVFRRAAVSETFDADVEETPKLIAAPVAAPEPASAPEPAAAVNAEAVVIPVPDEKGFGHFEAVPAEKVEDARDPLLRRIEEIRTTTPTDTFEEDEPETISAAEHGYFDIDDTDGHADPDPVLRERAARMRGKDDGFAAE